MHRATTGELRFVNFSPFDPLPKRQKLFHRAADCRKRASGGRSWVDYEGILRTGLWQILIKPLSTMTRAVDWEASADKARKLPCLA